MLQKLPVPPSGQKTYWEDGFGVRVSQGGTKSFVVMYGKDRRLKTIGRYPDMTLKAARREAQAFLAAPTATETPIGLSEARTAFLKDCEARLRERSVENYRQYLKPLTKAHLEDVERGDLPQTPNHIMAGKVFFNWCIREGYIERNPFAHIRLKYQERDRVLTPDEINALWAYDFRPFSDHIKLMLLTGLRRNECNHLTVDDDTITLPADHSKNRHVHVLPLTPLVKTLFPLETFSGWSKGKARVDEKVPLPHWTLHSLRRTFATIHAQLGTRIEVVSALLNHRSGVMNPVTRIYIRHNFLAEAREAQLRYELHISQLTGTTAQAQ